MEVAAQEWSAFYHVYCIQINSLVLLLAKSLHIAWTFPYPLWEPWMLTENFVL